MRNLSIRLKLALLAGIPVLGALALGLFIAAGAKRSAETAAALGSVEELAALVANISDLVQELESERSLVARELGVARDGRVDDAAIRAQRTKTEAAREAVLAFARQQNKAPMPERLARSLATWKTAHARLTTLTSSPAADAAAAERMMIAYGDAVHSLIAASAGLAELTQDGEILRYVNASVALLELKERASQEHAWLSYVLGVGEFPPGAYKTLVTLGSEAQTYDDVFRMAAPREILDRPWANVARPEYKKTAQLRASVLSALDNEFTVSQKEWFEVGQTQLASLHQLERAVVAGVHQAAAQKVRESRRGALIGGGMSAFVLTLSLVLAVLITRGLMRSVRGLQLAVQSVAKGDLETRFEIATNDELGQLGKAFNGMVSELKESRSALREQAMMRRELEIAASIQQALLPPAPEHPEFEFAGRMSPADEVGGDFFDVLTDREHSRLWITVGDVSGHGLRAGLVMLMAQSAFGAHFRADSAARPDHVLRGVNALLCEQIGIRLHEDKYVTAQLWMYEGQGKFAVAGAHVWPIVYRAASGRCELIEANGPWLGIIDDLPDIPISHITLEHDDVLCLYSDGLTEARDQQGELFDVERMKQAVAAAVAQDDLSGAADDIMRRISDHAASREDDWTLLLIRRRDAASISGVRSLSSPPAALFN